MEEQMKEKLLKHDFPIRTCVCGKDFVPTGQWVYKIYNGHSIKYYCSYTCWRKAGGGTYKFEKKHGMK